MTATRKRKPPVLERSELEEIRTSLRDLKDFAEDLQALVGSLDRRITTLVRLDQYMQVGLVRLSATEPKPKKEKKPKRCRKHEHAWKNVGTRTDSPMRCVKCGEWA